MSVQFGGGTGKSTTTQTRNVAAPSAQEQMLQALNAQAATAQANELQRAIQAQQQYEQSGGFQQAQQLGQQAGGLLKQDMEGGQLISPAQQQALQTYFQSIMAPQQQQMRDVAGQEAARRGMTISDSPIGNSFLDKLASYNAQMGGQQAGQALQLQQNNRGMQQNLMGLGQQLQQNAAQNRLQLASAQPGSYQLGNQMAQQRIQSAPVTTQQSGQSKAPTYGFSLGDTIGAAQGANNLWYGSGNKDVGTRPLGPTVKGWFS